MSPLFAVTGQDAEIEPITDSNTIPSSNPPEAERVAKHLQSIHSQLQHHLRKSQARYKMTADAHRVEEPQYHINDLVLLSTKNVRTDRPTKKLDYIYIGPYRIKRRINSVAYELDLPTNSRLHPVFHTSLLKPYKADPSNSRRVILPPPLASNDGEQGWILEEILDVRRKGNGYQYLIKWLDYGHEDDTWETRTTLKDDELLRAWHKENPEKPSPFKGGGETIVTNSMFATSSDSNGFESTGDELAPPPPQPQKKGSTASKTEIIGGDGEQLIGVDWAAL